MPTEDAAPPDARQELAADTGTPALETPTEVLRDEVRTTTLPRYAMPSISSMLPGYGNVEQEAITRAFQMANYDSISRLPANLQYTEVARARKEAMEKARTMTVVKDDEFQPHAVTKNGLFSEFEYLTSAYSLYDELETKAREESKAKIAAISGTDFKPTGNLHKGKYEDGFQEGAPFPYLADPYEAAEEMALRLKWIADAQALAGHWCNPGKDKVGDKPTRHLAGDMMAHIRKLILEDWEDADVLIYPNEDELWVIRIVLNEGIDSRTGLATYMNVFFRTNPVVQKYRLSKAVEHWDIEPGDGCVYFTVRPPWVAPDIRETFFTLHPEERSLDTILDFREANTDQMQAKDRTLQKTERNWRGIVRD